jgi:hypothetical protein
MAKVEKVTEKRIEFLQQRYPRMSFEGDAMDTDEGMRGLVRIIDSEGTVIGLEFIEPSGLWVDPDAIEEYKDTSADEIHITVIVPLEEKEDAEALVHKEVGEAVIILSYDDLTRPLDYISG